MSSNEIFPVPASWQGRAWIDEAGYRREYERSLRDPQGFWAEHAARLGILDYDDHPDAARVAAENVPGVRKVEDHRMRIADMPSMF